MAKLDGLKVAILASEGFEESELLEPSAPAIERRGRLRLTGRTPKDFRLQLENLIGRWRASAFETGTAKPTFLARRPAGGFALSPT